jgi:hypothetical protein
MDEFLECRIRTFFSFWRQRLDFIKALNHKDNYYEAHVLIWAAIDALSGIWKKSEIQKRAILSSEKFSNKLIFNFFLETYGGEFFSRVSLPDIWDRIDHNQFELPKGTSSTTEIQNLLRTIGGRQEPDDITRHLIRSVNDDQSIDVLREEVMSRFPETCKNALRKSLSLSQYGSIAYKELRCGYIHDGQPGKNSHSFPMYGYNARPTYLYGKYDTPSMMSFSPQFMIQVFSDIINGFEADSLQQNIDPVPED